jgi:small subunit ribosomal protein S4
MGDPKKFRKKYSVPKRPWDKTRILAENELMEKYGLVNKKEIMITKTMLGKKRKSARTLLAAKAEDFAKGKDELIGSFQRLGILTKDAQIDDVLALTVEDFFERRLQTLVYRQGLANTAKQARQFVVHGHIAIDGQRAMSPSILVTKLEEGKIKYFKNKKPKVLDKVFEKPELQKIADEIKQEIEVNKEAEKVSNEEKPVETKEEAK